MTLFVIGIILFFGVHFVPSMPLKSIMVNRLGEMRFKGLFSLISALGLGSDYLRLQSDKIPTAV
jgi:uncharacterized membrane protein